MESYWAYAVLAAVSFGLAFVCWVGDRQEKRIDAIEGQLNLMRQAEERARQATLDDGR